MENRTTSGNLLRAALAEEKPLQVVGTINAYTALLAEQAGFRALYLSGAGVANASFGLPDLGMTTLGDVLEDVRRITYASRLPLLVDVDTGWGCRRPHRGPGGGQALRAPAGKGPGKYRGDGGPDQGGR